MPPIISVPGYQFLSQAYAADFPLKQSRSSQLSAALEFALASPGKLLRGQLAWEIICSRTGATAALSAQSVALAVEYFQHASLILDDLPCMDAAEIRRGRTCLHLQFGESTAILVALALINRSYAKFWSALQDCPPGTRARAAELIEQCLGVDGVLEGQALDLAFGVPRAAGGSADAHSVSDIALAKTVPLFRLCTVVPALIAGASDRELQLLDRFASLTGLLYQSLDDLRDFAAADSEKSPRDKLLNRPNIVHALGLETAMLRIDKLAGLAERVSAQLLLQSDSWKTCDTFLQLIRDAVPFGASRRSATEASAGARI